MAMSEQQLRIILTDYVKKDALVQQLKDYVPLAEVDKAVATVAYQKVDEAIATDEIKDKVAQIAESAVTRLMQQEVQNLNEKIEQLRTEVKDSRKPTQDDAKEKEDEKEKDDEKDDEKSDDPKDKEIKQLKNMLK